MIHEKSSYNLAIVGAGRRGMAILEALVPPRKREQPLQVVAVADINPEAPGIIYAYRFNLFVTVDFTDLLNLPEIDIIVDATGRPEVIQQLCEQAPKGLTVLKVDWPECIEPLLKSAVPNLINYMDNLERRGVFRTYAAMLELRAKVAAHYDPEEITTMSDAFVLLLSILKKLSDPQMVDFMNRLLDLPMSIKFEEAKPLGPIGMLTAMGSKEGRQGLGVAMELTRALGKLGAKH